MAITDY